MPVWLNITGQPGLTPILRQAYGIPVSEEGNENGLEKREKLALKRNGKATGAGLRIGKRQGRPVTISVNGRKIVACEGETVHAALLAAGVRGLRKSRNLKESRGILCGMGVCYECLVTINGEPDRRACMAVVEERMEIEIDEA